MSATNPPEGRVVVTGPQALTNEETAAAAGLALAGKPASYIAVEADPFIASLVDGGWPHLLGRGTSRIYAGVRDTEALGNLPNDPRIVPVRVDLLDRASIQAAVNVASDIDLLVNNAAFAEFSAPFASNRESIRREALVNYLGTYDVVDAFLPVLQRTQGDCVVVLSKLAFVPGPVMAGYAIRTQNPSISPGERDGSSNWPTRSAVPTRE